MFLNQASIVSNLNQAFIVSHVGREQTGVYRDASSRINGQALDWCVQRRQLKNKWADDVEGNRTERWRCKILGWQPEWDGTKVDYRAPEHKAILASTGMKIHK